VIVGVVGLLVTAIGVGVAVVALGRDYFGWTASEPQLTGPIPGASASGSGLRWAPPYRVLWDTSEGSGIELSPRSGVDLDDSRTWARATAVEPGDDLVLSRAGILQKAQQEVVIDSISESGLGARGVSVQPGTCAEEMSAIPGEAVDPLRPLRGGEQFCVLTSDGRLGALRVLEWQPEGPNYFLAFDAVVWG